MAIAKFLHSTDIHAYGDMKDLIAVKDLANSINGLDAMLFTGDLFEGKFYLEKSWKCTKEIRKIVLGALSEADMQCITLHQKISEIGGEEAIKKALEQGEIPEQEKEGLTKILQMYEEKKPAIKNAFQKAAESEQKNQKQIVSMRQKTLEEMTAMIDKDIENMDAVLQDIKAPRYGVRGNHDPNAIYTLQNMTFLERLKNPVNVKGISIAGALGFHQQLNFGDEAASELFYSGVEFEPCIADMAEFIKKFGNKDDLKKFFENNTNYRRLKDKKFDMLLSHKGPFDMSVDTYDPTDCCGLGPGKWGFGPGLAKIVEEKKPIVLAGHVHLSEYYSDKPGYMEIRGSPNRSYLIHINTETKEIEQIDVYKRKHSIHGNYKHPPKKEQ